MNKYLEIQTQNYWMARKWLQDKDSSSSRIMSATSILSAISASERLGKLADHARHTLLNNKPSGLWTGTKP